MNLWGHFILGFSVLGPLFCYPTPFLQACTPLCPAQLCRSGDRNPGWHGQLRHSWHFQQALIWGPKLLWGSRALALPQVVGNGEGIHTHGHGLGGDDRKLLAVRAVLVDWLYHSGTDNARPNTCEPNHLLRLGVHCVNCPELTADVPEQDEEMVCRAFLHFLSQTRKKYKWTEHSITSCIQMPHANMCWLSAVSHESPECTKEADWQVTHLYNLVFCGSLTLPAKQQREMALWIMNLLDLKLGSL